MLINIKKTNEFYDSTIKKFIDYHIYFGNKDEFIEIIQSNIEINDRDTILINSKPGTSFEFSKPLFRHCFKNIIPKNLANQKFFLLKKSDNFVFPKDYLNGEEFIFKNQNGDYRGKLISNDKELPYNDVLSYYLYLNMLKLIRTDFFRNNSLSPDDNILFQKLFQEIEYLLMLNKNTRIREQIFYKLANLGLIYDRTKKIQLELNKSPEDLVVVTGSNEIICKTSGHKALKFYISAVTNKNIFYQFLDLYHVIESFFSKSRKYIFNKIKKTEFKYYLKDSNVNEENNTRCVMSVLETNKNRIFKKFKEIKREELRQAIGNKIPSVQINSLTPAFLPELGSFIYLIRCAIAHRGEDNHIEEKIKGSNIKNFIELNNFMFFLVDLILEYYESKVK